MKKIYGRSLKRALSLSVALVMSLTPALAAKIEAECICGKEPHQPRFPALEGDLKTEVLIIGGGAAGLLCAYFLEQEGVDYALVEADRICGGITKNTTAKVTAQHGLIYEKLIQEFGLPKASLYLQANQEAGSP